MLLKQEVRSIHGPIWRSLRTCINPTQITLLVCLSRDVYNDILKKAIGTGFYKLLARAFTTSLKLGFIPYVWKVAVLCMLIRPDKPPSETTSYRPISLLSSIMKLFERVIEKRLRKHLEDNSFFRKYQSGFRKSKSTNYHLFRLSQTIMESFNRGNMLLIAAFLDVEKVSTITVSESVINKIQRVQNSFIRLALRLPKYVPVRLIQEASGLQYVRERLITVGLNHLARMHANHLVEHTINSARTNIAWDKYETPISILKPPD